MSARTAPTSRITATPDRGGHLLIDVLQQIAAVNGALQNVAIGLLDEHVGHCVANAAADLGYGDPRGNARLREVLCGWLATTRGVRTDPDGIIVVAGQRAIAVDDPGLPRRPGRAGPLGSAVIPGRVRSQPALPPGAGRGW